MSEVKWMYGVTTVPSRAGEFLPQTLASLAKAGFDKPRLFIDGAKDAAEYAHYSLEATCHFPQIRTAGIWMLAIWELYVRDPHANRYAIFQDDILCCANLREYLESCPFPEKAYLSLVTYPRNMIEKPSRGWFPATSRGLGAQALVFDNNAVEALLGNSHPVTKFKNEHKGHRNLDGTVYQTFKAQGIVEYTHNPSLIYHLGTGEQSSMGNVNAPVIDSFEGEDYDPLTDSTIGSK